MTDTETPHGRRAGRPGRRWIAWATLGLAAAGLGAAWLACGRHPGDSVAQRFRQARQSFIRGDYERAEELAAEAFRRDATHADAATLAAAAAERLGEPARAVSWLHNVPPTDPDSRAEARLKAGQLLHYSLYRLRDAEIDYRAVLDVRPDDPVANEHLARLLSVCGRRDEAIPHVIRLIRAGVETDLVILLARESGSLNDPELLRDARAAAPNDANPLIGQAWSAIAARDYAAAVARLQRAVELPDPPLAAWSLLGRCFAEQRAWADVRRWLREAPAEARDRADGWLARAVAAEAAGDAHGAIRAWGELMHRRPESRRAAAQLARLLAADGQARSAELCEDWAATLDRISLAQHRALFSDDEHTYDELVALIVDCHAAGRTWEALAWERVAGQIRPRDERLTPVREDLVRRIPQLPLTITDPAAHPAGQIDLAAYPLPDVSRPPSELTQPSSQPPRTAIAFADVATEAGLIFQYFNGTRGRPTHRMYEFAGGGVAVLDFDRDDRPDVFLTQGTDWPPGGPGDESAGAGMADSLFRNRRGTSFAEVRGPAGIRESDFGQGVTVGDINEDGFPDLLVANIGRNRLWVNQGDGSFVSREPAAAADNTSWTTSCLIADLNGDTVADLYEVNYVTADDVFDRVCRGAEGQPVMCAPHDFAPAGDQIRLGNGRGGFRTATEAVMESADTGHGLGILAFREASTGLSLFIANDKTANALLRPVASFDGVILRDAAFSSGVAFNGRGESEACMGIACGDVNGDGVPDLFVTNYWRESNTLYAGTTTGFYTDRTEQFGLSGPSLPLLGFGTQFLDADRDGTAELFVSNGHIEDVRKEDQPFRMPPQLFVLGEGGFRPADPASLGDYFMTGHVGRAAARLDWNRDGRDDLIIGHLDTPVALLSNTTVSSGAELSLRLVGGAAGRDALGARIRWTIGNRTRSTQVFSGDGYQCSNERRLGLGCGSATHVDELVIEWPSGRELVGRQLPVAARYAADEDSERILRLPD